MEPKSERPCIVVVEDEAPLLEVIRDMLSMADFRVVGVGRPGMLLDTLSSLHPNLFLIDIMLPGMSGIELAEALRSAGQTAPIITMSASKLMSKVATESAAVDDSIDKVFDAVALVDSIKYYLAPESAGTEQQQISSRA
ncbi:MAG TPA: response regulator [Dehalococcoidia bacterium]|jgi:DNA-binding response OmpR family regulator